MRAINEIIIHSTDTRPDWWKSKSTIEKVAEVRRWHTQGRGWHDIGYHFLIDRDGTITNGRPFEKVGAHTKGHNKESIGIALFGGHNSASSDVFRENFTKAQEIALRDQITKLKKDYPKIKKISGHNEYAEKACPGFSVPAWFEQKPVQNTCAPVTKTKRTSPAQSSTVRASVAAAGSAAVSAVTAISALDSIAQYIVLACAGIGVLMSIWIMKERLRKWSLGDR